MRVLFTGVLFALATSCASAGRFPELPRAEQLAFHRCWYNVVKGQCGSASLYQDDCTRSHRAEYASLREGERAGYLLAFGCRPEVEAAAGEGPATGSESDTGPDTGSETDTGSEPDTNTETDTDTDTETDTDTAPDMDTGTGTGAAGPPT